MSRPAHSAATLRVLPSLRSVASALLPVLIGLAAPALRAQSSVPYTPVGQSNGIQSEWRTVKEMPGQWRTDVRLTNLSIVPKFVWVSYRFTCPDGRVVRGGLADDAGFTLRDHKSDFFYPACGGPGPRSISISYSCVVDTPPGVDGYATCVAIKTGQPTPQQRQQEEQRKAALAQQQEQQRRAQEAQQAALAQQQQQLAQANQQRRDAAAATAALQRQQQDQAQQANLAAQRARDQQQQQARAALQQQMQQMQQQYAQQQAQSLQSLDRADDADVATEQQRLRDGYASDGALLRDINMEVMRASAEQLPGVLQRSIDRVGKQATQARNDGSAALKIGSNLNAILGGIGRVMASRGQDNSATDALKRKQEAANSLNEAHKARAEQLVNEQTMLEQQLAALRPSLGAPDESAAPAAFPSRASSSAGWYGWSIADNIDRENELRSLAGSFLRVTSGATSFAFQ